MGGLLGLAAIPVSGADGGVDQFAAQQSERRLPVKCDVVERIGQDLEDPYQPGRHATGSEQLDHAKQPAADADHKPERSDMADEIDPPRRWWEDAEQGRENEQG